MSLDFAPRAAAKAASRNKPILNVSRHIGGKMNFVCGIFLGMFWILPASNVATAQVIRGTPHAATSCDPAPCVLSPTQASEGGAEVTDTPVVANPTNPDDMLLGSVDYNCPGAGVSGFHVSGDRGSTWSVYCTPVLHFQNRVYYPGGEPMVGYDLNGSAYIADGYLDSEGLGYALIAIQKSNDGLNWTQPVVAVSEGFSEPLYSSMALDNGAASPYRNSLYISTVISGEPGGYRNEVIVARSHDGGKTWSPAAVDPIQLAPAIDRWTNVAVGVDGSIYVTWMHCPGAGHTLTAITARNSCCSQGRSTGVAPGQNQSS
jgi:hypothetical protein